MIKSLKERRRLPDDDDEPDVEVETYDTGEEMEALETGGFVFLLLLLFDDDDGILLSLFVVVSSGSFFVGFVFVVIF